MTTKIIKGSKTLFGASNTDKNKIFGYLRITYDVDTVNRLVNYYVEIGTEYYYYGGWDWGSTNKGVISLKVNNTELFTTKKVNFSKDVSGWTTINGGKLTPIIHKKAGPFTAQYDAFGKASITVSFILSAMDILNTANGIYYDLTTQLNTTTVAFDDIDPVSATITKYPAEWNVDNPLELTIDNPAGLPLNISLTGNGVDIVKRSAIELTDNKYIFNLTNEERRVLYKQVPDEDNVEFKISLTSVMANKTVTNNYEIDVEYPARAWIKINNVWKRAFVWVRDKESNEWKQCFPWIKIDDKWKQV